MANPSQNVFNMSPIQGQMDLRFNPAVLSGFIDASSAGGLVPGQAVKAVSKTGSAFGALPIALVEIAAITDDIFGILIYNIKNQTFGANMAVEVAAMRDNVIYLTSGAAIATNAKVQMVLATPGQVITQTGSNRVVGRALDGASGSGQLIRVMIDLPGLTS